MKQDMSGDSLSSLAQLRQTRQGFNLIIYGSQVGQQFLDKALLINDDCRASPTGPVCQILFVPGFRHAE